MAAQGDRRRLALVVAASSAGTALEWYDFYLYGSLAVSLTHAFFSGVDETTGFILDLLVFSAGFATRPLGSLVFGRLGDRWGRKNTFLVTLLIMGASTFAVGLLPSFAQIGLAAPLILVSLRMTQGLALGGEYGGAAIYVAEHAPIEKRGFYTSGIQITATIGLVLSLACALAVRTWTGEAAFSVWGWRIPFLVSSVLLAGSLWMRLKLRESPVFQRMAAAGRTSKAPLKDSITDRRNLGLMLAVLFGLTAGQGVISYVGQIYTLLFMEKTLRVPEALSNQLVAGALIVSAPFYVLFGWLSDRIGPRKIVFACMALAMVSYLPLFHGLTTALNPALDDAMRARPVTVLAPAKTCTFQFHPVGKPSVNSPCDVVTGALTKAGADYTVKVGGHQDAAVMSVGGVSLTYGPETARPAFEHETAAALTKAGYPSAADPARMNIPAAAFFTIVIEIFVAMAYAPISVALVGLFPARVRYTSMSLPYHLGNGWFGGFLPPMAFALVTATGNIYAGMGYPLAIMGMSLVIGAIFLRKPAAVDPEDAAAA